MERKICFFTGHRMIPEREMGALPEKLENAISDLYGRGVREFRAGGAVGFDTLAALKVIAFRNRYPDVRLALILPCRDQDARWSDFDRAAYRFVIKQADSVFYLHDQYTPDCMHERNRALASGSDFCVTYMNRQSGGTAYTVKLAERAGIPVLNLAPSALNDENQISMDI